MHRPCTASQAKARHACSPASADSRAAAAAQLRVGNKLPVVWSGHDGHADEAEAAPGSREASSQAATSEADDLELPGFTLVDSIVAAIEVTLPHLPGGCWGCSKAFRAACEVELGLGAMGRGIELLRAMLVDSSVAAIEGTSCSVGCWQLCWAFDGSAWRCACWVWILGMASEDGWRGTGLLSVLWALLVAASWQSWSDALSSLVRTACIRVVLGQPGSRAHLGGCHDVVNQQPFLSSTPPTLPLSPLLWVLLSEVLKPLFR